MLSVQACSLPDGALLGSRRQRGRLYRLLHDRHLQAQCRTAQYVTAFYTTWVFKLERLILKWAVSRPSTDTHAELARGGND